MTFDPIKAGRFLHEEQSLKYGIYGALITALTLNILWILISMFFDRFFPWISIIQGILIGKSARKYGHGLNWHLPLTAALIAIMTSVTGSFFSALYLTGREFNTGAWVLFDEISWHTISTFMINEFGVVGCIYACCAALLATYYAKRQLNREQSIAYRKYQERNQLNEKNN
jgi:hypothetical protein|tara:strand:- start:87 stop:599 length:513 start_codon:yes stop_codon:yes gene_type:complete